MKHDKFGLIIAVLLLIPFARGGAQTTFHQVKEEVLLRSYKQCMDAQIKGFFQFLSLQDERKGDPYPSRLTYSGDYKISKPLIGKNKIQGYLFNEVEKGWFPNPYYVFDYSIDLADGNFELDFYLTSEGHPPYDEGKRFKISIVDFNLPFFKYDTTSETKTTYGTLGEAQTRTVSYASEGQLYVYKKESRFKYFLNDDTNQPIKGEDGKPFRFDSLAYKNCIKAKVAAADRGSSQKRAELDQKVDDSLMHARCEKCDIDYQSKGERSEQARSI